MIRDEAIRRLQELLPAMARAYSPNSVTQSRVAAAPIGCATQRLINNHTNTTIAYACAASNSCMQSAVVVRRAKMRPKAWMTPTIRGT